MNDTIAKKNAKRIREGFWEDFDRALGPKEASKRAYADELEELISDAEMRLEAVRAELSDEDT